jgi:hypothetical protein
MGGLTDVISSPIYSTGVGLVKYAYKNRNGLSKKSFSSKNGDNPFVIIKNWFSDLIEYFF